MALLEVSGLTVRFGGLTAVSRLDFSVEEGALVALIGPNGAGDNRFNVITGVYRRPRQRALAGRDRRSRPHLRARVSRTFRTSAVPGAAALENAGGAAGRAPARRARRAARRRLVARRARSRSRARALLASSRARGARADSSRRRAAPARIARAPRDEAPPADEPAAHEPRREAGVRGLIANLRRTHGDDRPDRPRRRVRDESPSAGGADHGEKIADEAPERCGATRA
jgi:branched-chain amino acid transport system ATP-binding protein